MLSFWYLYRRGGINCQERCVAIPIWPLSLHVNCQVDILFESNIFISKLRPDKTLNLPIIIQFTTIMVLIQ